MKKIIVFSLMTSVLFSDYDALLMEAYTDFQNGNYENSEKLLTSAINEDNLRSDAYIERAEVRNRLNKPLLALEDIKNSSALPKSFSQSQKSLFIEMVAYASLERYDEASMAWNLYKENVPGKPYSEETKDYIIIHNVPDNPTFKNMISRAYVKEGICNKEDIKWMDGKCVIKKLHVKE